MSNDNLREAEGRYTIAEALHLLQANTSERFPELLAAVHADEIKAYAPKRYNKPIPGNLSERLRLPRGMNCGDDQLEIFSSDLDKWLADKYPRVKFRFSEVGTVKEGKTLSGSQRELPGTLPKVGSGRMAVKAAWQIECETGRVATADKVMCLLQKWADEGSEPDVLLKSNKGKKSVQWKTKKTSLPKEYDLEACGKTLEAWSKSRA